MFTTQLQHDNSRGLKVTPTTLIKTVAATGTPEKMTATAGTYASRMIVMGKKAAQTNNTGSVFIGEGSADAAQAVDIATGAKQEFVATPGQVFDLSEWYIDVATNGDGVVVFYW